MVYAPVNDLRHALDRLLQCRAALRLIRVNNRDSEKVQREVSLALGETEAPTNRIQKLILELEDGNALKEKP